MFQPDSDLRASDLFRISKFEFRASRQRRAFTLVEMLVVIGIIVVLVALLVPMGSIAVSRTRDWNMSAEIGQLAQSIERYKNEKGDYPPSMSEKDLLDVDGDGTTDESLYIVAPYTSVCERHLRKCFPKITPREKAIFYNDLAPYMTPAESLWFWLSQTQNDERQPFFSTSRNYKKYYDFKPDRVQQTKVVQLDMDGDGNRETPFTLNAYKPAYAKETGFIYLDSRTYHHHYLIDTNNNINWAADGVAQPYGDYVKAQQVKANGQPIQNMTVHQRMLYQFMNPTTFQILCAGQDGEWGPVATQFNPQGYPRDNIQAPNPNPPPSNDGLRQFPNGIVYNDGDKDNLTNFSEGRRLENHIE